MTPDLNRMPVNFHAYISLVSEPDLVQAFAIHTTSFLALLHSLPPEKYEHRYASDKWTIQEVLQHVIDCERIFAYRALCIARKEKQILPGFDENEYADHSKASKRKWADLVDEFTTVRKSSLQLFSSFDEDQLDEHGVASSGQVYVLGLAYALLGHAEHHLIILKERYMKNPG